jgi:hypothetical protein
MKSVCESKGPDLRENELDNCCDTYEDQTVRQKVAGPKLVRVSDNSRGSSDGPQYN